jgi:hypothetical protein
MTQKLSRTIKTFFLDHPLREEWRKRESEASIAMEEAERG